MREWLKKSTDAAEEYGFGNVTASPVVIKNNIMPLAMENAALQYCIIKMLEVLPEQEWQLLEKEVQELVAEINNKFGG